MYYPMAGSPICPACRQAVGHRVFQSNYCVAFVAHAYLTEHPRSTAWEISRGTGMEYERVAAAMPKARLLNLVYVDSDEQLTENKRRYRFIAANRPDAYTKLAETHAAQVAEMRRGPR